MYKKIIYGILSLFFLFSTARSDTENGINAIEKIFFKKLKRKRTKEKKIELIYDFMDQINLKISQLKQQKTPSVERLTDLVLTQSYLRALNLNKKLSLDMCSEKKQLLKNINHPNPSKRKKGSAFNRVQRIINHLCY